MGSSSPPVSMTAYGTHFYAATSLLESGRTPAQIKKTLRWFLPGTIFSRNGYIVNGFKSAIAWELKERFGEKWAGNMCQLLNINIPIVIDQEKQEAYIQICRAALLDGLFAVLDRKFADVTKLTEDIIRDTFTEIFEELGFENIQMTYKREMMTPAPGSIERVNLGKVKVCYLENKLSLSVKRDERQTIEFSCNGKVWLPGGERTFGLILQVLAVHLEKAYDPKAEIYRLREEVRILNETRALSSNMAHSLAQAKEADEGTRNVVDIFISYVYSTLHERVRSLSLLLFDSQTGQRYVPYVSGVDLHLLEQEAAFSRIKPWLLDANSPDLRLRYSDFCQRALDPNRRRGDFASFRLPGFLAGAEGKFMGVFNVATYEGFPLRWTDLFALKIAIGILSDNLALGEQARELRLFSERDGLTGMYNKTKGTERLSQSLLDAQSRRVPLSLLMLDMDHFKAVNDEHGHLIGDDILRQFSCILREFETEGAYLIRFGGEEFNLVLPGKNAQEAALIAERIRLRVEKAKFKIGTLQIQKTVSIGVGSKTEGESVTIEQLMQKADDAVYAAKQRGRNRVETWDTSTPPHSK